jgi:polar amino acid transport system substrate-binding protein
MSIHPARSALTEATIASQVDALPAANRAIVEALAPGGSLRAGINLSNFLLVTQRDEAGAPIGVSPDMAAALAKKLGVELKLVPFDSPGQVADAVGTEWDIGNIGAEPARAKHIAFTSAYCEIESTCLVPAGSSITSFAEVDQPGVRIATKHRAAYTLWLERNLKHAELVQVESIDASFDAFVEQKLDVLAGLRPRLLDDADKLAGSRILADKFASVQQAIGTPRDRPDAGIDYLHTFVAAAIGNGLVGALIDYHQVQGKLSVAPQQS